MAQITRPFATATFGRSAPWGAVTISDGFDVRCDLTHGDSQFAEASSATLDMGVA